jgi:hypothetical protein
MSLLAKNLVVSAAILNDPTRPFTQLELLKKDLENTLSNFSAFRQSFEDAFVETVDPKNLN